MGGDSNAGIKVSAILPRIPYSFQSITGYFYCKRGLVWGELEFVLPDEKVVRLHCTEWGETKLFTIILMLTGGGGVAR
ncbi:hypothetical protein ACVXHB_08475 [Escherichia coli]